MNKGNETAVPLQCDLHFEGQGSDKVYHAIVEKQGDGYLVNFAYGRRGSTLTRGTKTSSAVSYEKAMTIFNRLINEKVSKGYRSAPGISGQVFRTSSANVQTPNKGFTMPNEKKSTGILPQLLNPITEEETETYLKDDSHGSQEKKNGRRILLRSDGDQVTGINKKGFLVDISPKMEENVQRLNHPILIDGEAIGDIYHAFGILEWNNADLRRLPYGEMHNELCHILDGHSQNGLRVLPLYTTEAKKRQFLKQLKEEKKEGIVFKLLSAPYSPGRPSSGGPHLKCKFYETISVICLGSHDSKRSIRIGVHLIDNDPASDIIPIGNVTIPPNSDIPELSSVCEVRYLYAYRGGSLYQPVYLGERDDVDPGECWQGHIKYIGKDDED